MNHRVVSALALVLAACPGGTGPIVTGPFNFDYEIDGGGQDFNNPIDGWAADQAESSDANFCRSGNGNLYAVWAEDKPDASYVDVWFTRSTDEGTTWLASPIRVKQGPGDASGVHMACIGERIYVVWEDTRDGQTGYGNIYLNYSTDQGDTWLEEDKALDNDPDGFAISQGPKVALFEGQVHVTWYDQVEGAPDVYVATSVNGGRRFELPVRVSGGEFDEETEQGGPGSAWNGNPDIAIDPSGRIYIVWESTRNGNQDIFAAVSNDQGRTYGAERRIDRGDGTAGSHSFNPRIGVGDGTAYIVWHDERNGVGRDILMNYTNDGGATWLTDAVVVETSAPGATDSINPDLAVVGDKAHIVWQDNVNSGYDIFYRVATNGVFDASEAGKEVRLDTDDAGVANSVRPQIVVSGDQVVVAWSDYRSDRSGEGFYTDIYYNYMTMGEDAAWAEEDLPLKSIEGQSTTADLHIALSEGVLFTSWLDGRNGNDDVFFSRVTLGEGVENVEEIYARLQTQAQ